MLQKVFMYICQWIVPFVHKTDANFRNIIPVELRIAVTLYFLPGHADYYKIANLLDLGKAKLFIIFHSASKAVVKNLKGRFIYLLCNNDVSNIMATLQEM